MLRTLLPLVWGGYLLPGSAGGSPGPGSRLMRRASHVVLGWAAWFLRVHEQSKKDRWIMVVLDESVHAARVRLLAHKFGYAHTFHKNTCIQTDSSRIVRQRRTARRCKLPNAARARALVAVVCEHAGAP